VRTFSSIAVALSLVAFGALASLADETSDGVAKDCAIDWPDNYRMQEYCINNQREAAAKLLPILESVKAGQDEGLKQAVASCIQSWKNANALNYRMVLYCTEQQISAKQRLDQLRDESERRAVGPTPVS
jgi:hypothetical protein